MASRLPANPPSTPAAKERTAHTASPPANHSVADANRHSAAPVHQGPHGQPFPFYSSQDGAPNGELPQDAAGADQSDAMNGVQYPHGMPVYQYGNVMPGPPIMARPKRTQCKNACTNCQKACKKCDDNRPCHRCVRYGTGETCVDSKRKERKKGVKRGPYKKRDSKSNAGDNDEGSTVGSGHGPPHMPYVGPVGYPPGMWSTYPPGGPGAKLEGGGYYQPVFALTPVGPHGSESENPGGSSGDMPPFPVGFYPATFISYPGYPPYPMPPGQGSLPHGFHYAYPPPSGMFAHKPPAIAGDPSSEPGSPRSPGSPGSRTSSMESQVRDVPDGGAAVHEKTRDKDKDKDKAIEPQDIRNGRFHAERRVNGAVGRERE